MSLRKNYIAHSITVVWVIGWIWGKNRFVCTIWLSVGMKSVVDQGFFREFTLDNKVVKAFVKFQICWTRLKLLWNSNLNYVTSLVWCLLSPLFGLWMITQWVGSHNMRKCIDILWHFGSRCNNRRDWTNVSYCMSQRIAWSFACIPSSHKPSASGRTLLKSRDVDVELDAESPWVQVVPRSFWSQRVPPSSSSSSKNICSAPITK